MDFLSPEALNALWQVIAIDLVLAGDNAVVIGLAAAGLPADQRKKAILVGIIAATVLRIFFALIATQLLAVTGLLLAGGILLLWVSWKMWRELREGHEAEHMASSEALAGRDLNADGTIAGGVPRKTLGQAVWQIVIADVSMSLDNVLAVSGAAHEHPEVLVFGLALSIALMIYPLCGAQDDLGRLGAGPGLPSVLVRRWDGHDRPVSATSRLQGWSLMARC